MKPTEAMENEINQDAESAKPADETAPRPFSSQVVVDFHAMSDK